MRSVTYSWLIERRVAFACDLSWIGVAEPRVAASLTNCRLPRLGMELSGAMWWMGDYTKQSVWVGGGRIGAQRPFTAGGSLRQWVKERMPEKKATACQG